MEFIVDHKTLGDIPYAINLKGRELTRCRDCRHWATERRFTFGCVGKSGKPDPDGYCAWGERRKEDG